MAFHPNGTFDYLINEVGAAVTAFSYDPARGTLSQLQTISTLTAGFTGNNDSTEIEVHPNGKFLYASNRGHGSIAVFAIDTGNGTLTSVEQVPTQEKKPRTFAIDPTGAYLLAANQDSGNIVPFRIDAKTGRLTPTGGKVKGSPARVPDLPAIAVNT